MRVLLVRHASAGDPKRWQGDDRLRPLDRRGRRQAEALVELLAPYPLERLLSSPYVRCLQTFEPLAENRGLAVEATEALAEGAGAHRFLELAAGLDAPAAVSVHGDLLEELLGDVERAKGSTWVVEADLDGVRPERYLRARE